MTGRQYVQTNSARVTLGVVAEQEEILVAFPGIAKVAGDLSKRLTTIDGLVREQEADETGITDNKEASRHALVDAILVVCGQLHAHGDDLADADLCQRTSPPKSDWLRVP